MNPFSCPWGLDSPSTTASDPQDLLTCRHQSTDLNSRDSRNKALLTFDLSAGADWLHGRDHRPVGLSRLHPVLRSTCQQHVLPVPASVRSSSVYSSVYCVMSIIISITSGKLLNQNVSLYFPHPIRYISLLTLYSHSSSLYFDTVVDNTNFSQMLFAPCSIAQTLLPLFSLVHYSFPVFNDVV